MPSFDLVSKVNIQEIDNAVNSVKKELTNRYDFKDAIFSIELNIKENLIHLTADSEYKLESVRDSLKVFATKRSVDVKAFEFKQIQKGSGTILKQDVVLKNGIDQEIAKKIIKQIKDLKFKVQASIRSDEIRVEGKKRDDLQQTINLIKSIDFGIPLQFINFRE
jgi:uncharacterized protein YajQ (UPF0234 family)